MSKANLNCMKQFRFGNHSEEKKKKNQINKLEQV